MLLFATALSGQLEGGAIQLRSASDLNPADTVFEYPGANNDVFAVPLVLAQASDTLTLTGPASVFRRQDEGNGFTSDFARGTRLLVPQSSAFVDISFAAPVTEVGLQAQTGYRLQLGAETLTAFNGSAQLGSWTISKSNGAASDGTAPFLGVRATDGDVITRIRVSNRVGGTEFDYYFGIGPIRVGPVATDAIPEPSSLLLLLTGALAAIAYRSFRRGRT